MNKITIAIDGHSSCGKSTMAKDLAKENLPKIRTTASFTGVGLSALILIPLACSLTIKPIMKKLTLYQHTLITELIILLMREN